MWTNPCADSIHPHSTKYIIIRKFGQFPVKKAAMVKAFTILTTLSNIVFAKLSDSCEVTAFYILFFLSFSNSRFINFSATMECASHWKRGDRFIILTWLCLISFWIWRKIICTIKRCDGKPDCEDEEDEQVMSSNNQNFPQNVPYIASNVPSNVPMFLR